MKNTRWITKRLMKMTCRLHVGYEIVGYKKKMCVHVAVIPSILEAALAGVTPANNIGHRTKIAMDNLLRTLPMVLAKQARTRSRILTYYSNSRSAQSGFCAGSTTLEAG